MITSEWGTPNMVENGVNPELLLAGKYGHALHVWDLRKRRHQQTLDLGAEQQMVLELRPAHDPEQDLRIRGRRHFAEGSLGVDLAVASRGNNGNWHVEDPEGDRDSGRSRRPDKLPPLLKGFKAVPPLVTDINLSLDDRFLYVSCWGTGELRQYDVSDPFNPVLTGSVQIGGIVRRTAHPKQPGKPLNGGTADGGDQPRRPARLLHELAVSHLGRAVLSGRHPRLDGEDWTPRPNGGMALDPKFLLEFDGCGRTRCTSKAATRLRIRTASREVMTRWER